MNLKVLLSERWWKVDVLRVRTIGFALEPLGASWLVYEPAMAYIPNLDKGLEPHRGILLVILCVVTMLWVVHRATPKMSRKAKLCNTNVSIEVVVGDIFAFAEKGAIVASSNTTFDICRDNDLISGSSLQGQITDRLYNSWRDMDNEAKQKLRAVAPTHTLTDDRKSNLLVYPVGTTVHLKPQGKDIYLVALTTMSAMGRSSSVFRDLQDALIGLWAFVARDGEHCPISIPLLGTGNARMNVTKEEVIRTIVDSFIAACAQQDKRFCNHLRIVVQTSDFEEGDVDLDEMGRYVEHMCKYALRQPMPREAEPIVGHPETA